jgi:hypothetical protein
MTTLDVLYSVLKPSSTVLFGIVFSILLLLVGHLLSKEDSHAVKYRRALKDKARKLIVRPRLPATEDPNIVESITHLFTEIARCHDAGATVASAAMVYVCIDIVTFMALPQGQRVLGKEDFIAWVDSYLKTESTQEYKYNGMDVYAARCNLLHAFSAESEEQRKFRSNIIFSYVNEGQHTVDSTDLTHQLVLISLPVLIRDLSRAVEMFFNAQQENYEYRMQNRLPILRDAFPSIFFTQIKTI